MQRDRTSKPKPVAYAAPHHISEFARDRPFWSVGDRYTVLMLTQGRARGILRITFLYIMVDANWTRCVLRLKLFLTTKPAMPLKRAVSAQLNDPLDEIG